MSALGAIVIYNTQCLPDVGLKTRPIMYFFPLIQIFFHPNWIRSQLVRISGVLLYLPLHERILNMSPRCYQLICTVVFNYQILYKFNCFWFTILKAFFLVKKVDYLLCFASNMLGE